jgi:citrate lyase synthetase
LTVDSLRPKQEFEHMAQIFLNAHEDTLAHRYLTEQAHTAAAGLKLIEALAGSFEARTKVL